MYLVKVCSIVNILFFFGLVIEDELGAVELTQKVPGAHAHFLETLNVQEHNPAEFVSLIIIEWEHVSGTPKVFIVTFILGNLEFSSLSPFLEVFT